MFLSIPERWPLFSPSPSAGFEFDGKTLVEVTAECMDISLDTRNMCIPGMTVAQSLAVGL